MSETMKHIVDLIFLLLFVGTIAPVMHYWVHVNLRDADASIRLEVRRLLRRRFQILNATCATVFIVGLVWIVLSFQGIHPFGERINFGIIVSCVVFHLIWWPLAAPIFSKLERLLQEQKILAPVRPTGPKRTATLRPRRIGNYVPRRLIFMTIALAIGAPLVLSLWIWTHPFQEPRLMKSALLFAGVGVLDLLLIIVCTRIVLAAPISVAHGHGPGKIEEIRGFRIRWMYAMCVGMALIFFGTSAAIIAVDRGIFEERSMGLAGAIVGTLFGLCGAAVGFGVSYREIRFRRELPRANEANRQ